MLWFMGDDISVRAEQARRRCPPGGKIAPIFFNTMEDAGPPIPVDVSKLEMGDVIDIFPFAGQDLPPRHRQVLAQFELKTDVLIDEVRAGGRIPLIIGRGLTDKARVSAGSAVLHRVPSSRSRWPIPAKASPWPRRWWARRVA